MPETTITGEGVQTTVGGLLMVVVGLFAASLKFFFLLLSAHGPREFPYVRNGRRRGIWSRFSFPQTQSGNSGGLNREEKNRGRREQPLCRQQLTTTWKSSIIKLMVLDGYCQVHSPPVSQNSSLARKATYLSSLCKEYSVMVWLWSGEDANTQWPQVLRR